MKSARAYRFQKLTARASIHLTLAFISLLCLIPLWLIVSASLTEDKALTLYGYNLIPSQFSTYAYQYIFAFPGQILRGYGVTIFVTVVGTALSLLITSLIAFALSRDTFSLRQPLAFFVFFTMLFGGGLVPYYLLMTRYLHLKDNIIALLVPYLVVPFYVLVLRTNFRELPSELMDAARVDGAGEWRIFFQIAVPLSRPALATIGLFLVLSYWNDWITALYFINDRNLYPLQYMLWAIMRSAEEISANPDLLNYPIPLQSVRMAMAVLATGPAALAFLAVQKYLVKGITLGSFK
jgi:putative aldouronate transport system permease protein